MHIIDGATSNSGEDVIYHIFFWCVLQLCRRQVTDIGVKLRGFFGFGCVLLSCLVALCAKARVLMSFQFCQIVVYMPCNLDFII